MFQSPPWAGLRRRLGTFVSPSPILGLLVAVLISVLLIQGWSAARPESIGDDAGQNLRYALNFSRHGVYSADAETDSGASVALTPGYRREPLPNWLLAGHLKWLVGVPPAAGFQEVVRDKDLFTRVIRINLVYFLGLLLSIWGLCLCLIRPGWLAHVTSLVVIYFSADQFAFHELEKLNTELIASFLLVLTALVFVSLSQRRSRWLGLLAGVLFGGLVLTKASGAYLALILLPLLALLIAGSGQRSVRLILCVALGFAITVLPWVGRNLAEFEDPAITRGGGKVLLFRSSFNRMTLEEFKGAFYAYAPRRMREDLLEPVFGFSPEQVQCGGSLQRLQRDLPCDARAIAESRFGDVKSFYKFVQPGLLAQLAREAREHVPPISEENYVKQVAIQRIKDQPLKHLLVSLPLAWRGMWSFENDRTWLAVLANGLSMASLLVMPWLGLLLRRVDWILMSMVGVGYFLFYALLSHFIARYSQPLIPLALLSLALQLITVIRWLISRWPTLLPSRSAA